MNYSTPIASRASSPLSHDNNESSMTHFNGPIVSSSESEVVSTSTGLVASVTWPDLRYLCSLAGSFQEPRLLKHLGGNLRATIKPIRTKICRHILYFRFLGHRLGDDLVDWNSGVSVRPYVHKKFFRFPSNFVFGYRPRPHMRTSVTSTRSKVKVTELPKLRKVHCCRSISSAISAWSSKLMVDGHSMGPGLHLVGARFLLGPRLVDDLVDWNSGVSVRPSVRPYMYVAQKFDPVKFNFTFTGFKTHY